MKDCKLCGRLLPVRKFNLDFCNISHQIQFHVNEKLKEHEEKYHS